MEQAYFSGIRSRIIPHLNNANKIVQVAMAWFTSSELYNALLDCLKRGVKVELVLLDDAINYMNYAPDFNQFIKEGGELRIARSNIGLMHHKFCVVDEKIAITGSYNWTYYAETRNVENIVISDNNEIIRLFSLEFQRLKNKLSICSSCPRLSWDDIEQWEDVDYYELNYEIEYIGDAQNKPIRRFFKTKTEVVRTEIEKKPIAKFAIGIQALDANNNVVFYSFINSGEKLPYRSAEIELYFDSKNMQEFPCLLIFGDPDNKEEWELIKEANLMPVAKGFLEENLPVTFSMNLDDNGSLRVDVSCAKSGQRLTISALNSRLVKYE